MKTRIVVGSRESEDAFFSNTALGRSMTYGRGVFGELRLFANNKKGLPEIYNEAILECRSDPALLIFVHDDVHILDYYWCNRVLEGLNTFDVVGVAGNVRRLPRQPSWVFVDTRWTWDKFEHLSGAVGHGSAFPPSILSVFGAPRQKVKLLDGFLLGCHSEMLLSNNIFFDDRFDFHFYDLDFCRQLEDKGLSCGTWDLSLVHESVGSFGSAQWHRAYESYLEKWGD